MSTFQMQCPNCGIVLEVEHQYIGVEAACEMCDFHFYVQVPESSSEIKPVASGSPITPQGQSSEKENYFLPPLSMLSYGDICEEDDSTQLSVIQSTLEEALKTCGIRGQISNCIKGPQVIRFEIKLEPGIHVNKVAQNADNIARSLALQNIRIIAPIPGLSAVGVEIPRNQMYPVFLRDLLESEQWCSSNAAIPIILGKDTANKPVILDLATESPILIAGGLGSGKSTCVNSLIMNLLFRFSPEDLKFIMVDPSGVELNAYNSLPHLLTPVINNDLSKFPTALRWAVGEMEKRYRILSAAKVKRFSDFNARQVAQEPIYDAELGLIPDKMPAIIIIVDGMSDSIISEMQGDIEAPITRIVQNGQRVGIYLIFVTQRPTINIISGTIKAGFLTRICFKVRSYRDSLIIFESKGAEALLGNGDMLCQSFSSRYIERIQCTFTPNSDILKVVEFISAQVPQQFNKEIHRDGDDDWWDSDEEDDEDDDIPWDIPDISASVRKYMRPGDSEVMQQAIEVVIKERKASTSYLQRRLGIGYNRAAELIDQMEERGIVGPSSGWGNKREILVFDGIKINEASDDDDDNYSCDSADDDDDDDNNYSCDSADDDDDDYDCDNNNDNNDKPKNIIQRWGCLTIIWIICLVYFLNGNISVWLAINLSFAVPVFIFLMKLHRDLDEEKIPIGCLMYCILEIIAFVFMMHCTDSFWIALFFSLTVPVGVFSALAQSSGNS